jgi:hypothetical protein
VALGRVGEEFQQGVEQEVRLEPCGQNLGEQ